MSVEIRTLSRQTVITTTYTVSGVPATTYRYQPTAFRPACLIVEVTDGSLTHVTAWGPRTKKDGSDGAIDVEYRFLRGEPRPAWIDNLLRGMGLLR